MESSSDPNSAVSVLPRRGRASGRGGGRGQKPSQTPVPRRPFPDVLSQTLFPRLLFPDPLLVWDPMGSQRPFPRRPFPDSPSQTPLPKRPCSSRWRRRKPGDARGWPRNSSRYGCTAGIGGAGHGSRSCLALAPAGGQQASGAPSESKPPAWPKSSMYDRRPQRCDVCFGASMYL